MPDISAQAQYRCVSHAFLPDNPDALPLEARSQRPVCEQLRSGPAQDGRRGIEQSIQMDEIRGPALKAAPPRKYHAQIPS